MATYASSLQAVHRPSAPAPYLISNTIDIAVENTNNAAALAANDILQIFTIPTDTLLMSSLRQWTQTLWRLVPMLL